MSNGDDLGRVNGVITTMHRVAKRFQVRLSFIAHDQTRQSSQGSLQQERKILLPATVQLPSCSSRTAEEQRKNLVTSASVVDWLLSGCVVGRQFNAI